MTEAVLSAIGARSRRMIESELSQGSEGIAMADILKARRSIASTAIRMSHEGAFELPTAASQADAA
jgi:flagellar motor switch protein FliG